MNRTSLSSSLICSSVLTLFLAACNEAGPPLLEPGAVLSEAQAYVPPTKQLALGRAHGCSLDPAISGVLCWGANQIGQATVPALSSPTFIAAGGDVSCAIARDGVDCWGDDSHGQLRVPLGLRSATQLAVGDAHVCALLADGAVRCWGDDSAGQLAAPALQGVQMIGAGARHSCALTASSVRCWGDDSVGQLKVPALTAPTRLAVGGSHSCVIDSGKVVCWGGESPALVAAIPAVRAPVTLASGAAHSCVVDAEGVKCWGDGAASNLEPRDLTFPVQLAVGGGRGLAHACARHLQGVACWGDNSLGQTDYDGSPLHLLYRSESDIAAPPALVWEVLMDLDSYPKWNPYTTGMQSTLEVGDPMIMDVKMSPILTIEQTEYIRLLSPGYKVCWGIDTTTPEFNSGERCQWLEPLPDGGTHYITEDLIEGTANPLVTALFGEAVGEGFDSVASALKARAESLVP